jgi:hypothetical protein
MISFASQFLQLYICGLKIEKALKLNYKGFNSDCLNNLCHAKRTVYQAFYAVGQNVVKKLDYL